MHRKIDQCACMMKIVKNWGVGGSTVAPLTSQLLLHWSGSNKTCTHQKLRQDGDIILTRIIEYPPG